MYELDEIYLALLKECSQNPGKQLACSLKPLLDKRSKRRLYYRFTWLEKYGFISVDRLSEKRKSKATITQKGLAAITGRENRCPALEARSS